MTTRRSSPGKALITMDLPRAVHSLLFDSHAGIRVQREHDGVRVLFSESGGSVEILLDEATLDALLAMIEDARHEE